MGIKALSEAVAHIAMELHPERIEAICSTLDSRPEESLAGVIRSGLGAAFSPELMELFEEALRGAKHVTANELSAMFRASSMTAALAACASSVELVWTGPGTGMVPIRHTEQVLTGLIDESKDRLFLVSFVAYDVASVMNALRRAGERGVQVRLLVEKSVSDGGTVTIDSVATIRQSLPKALTYVWDREGGGESTRSSVHAKCAVADGRIAFITSANLSVAAMERNMELGVLLRGGHVPVQLENHLAALVATKQLKSV
jgi:cardiolipin synthase